MANILAKRLLFIVVSVVGQPYYARLGGVPYVRFGRPGAVFGRTW